ncbi:MAG: orotidine-5'-phosphate decarboxylase [Gemmatimonadota bacterium]|nr:MAG: orotidine-5'-phosphate decarboxylase [Gemmatimonadota bacterium]
MAEIIVALDFPSANEAMGMIDLLGAEEDFYKVGLELYARAGPDFVRTLTGTGRRVFLDLKLHDIPNTVVGGVRAAAEMGVELLTVHCSGGRAMLEAAAGAADGRLGIVGVTLLTSLATEDVEAVWGRCGADLGDEVLRLGAMAREAGLKGVVASGSEVARLKSELGAEFKVVTPGIRPAGSDIGDQARVVTPAAAAASGSDYLVVGRPVTRAEDPVAALRAIREEATL